MITFDLKNVQFCRNSIFLTLNGPGKFRIHPKIRCLTFKQQYLNYSSPTNESYRFRKKTIRAFKPIFELLCFDALAPDLAPKLCTPRVSNCISAALNLFSIFWALFLDFGDIMSISRGKASNAMEYCRKILFKSFLHHAVSW